MTTFFMTTFTPDKRLLNPKFEGYKLDPVNQDELVCRFPLSYQLSQSIVSASKAPLSFHEIQSRITHNHLFVAPNGTRAIYVDGDYQIISIDFATNSHVPVFYVIYELPRPVQSSSSDAPQKDYASAVFLTPSDLFLSDGSGTLYAFQWQSTGRLDLLASYQLPSGVPFRVHTAAISLDSSVIVLLSSPDYHSPQSDKKTKTVTFDVTAVRVALPISPSPGIQTFNAAWRRKGSSVPAFTAFDQSRSSFLLVGEHVYESAKQPPAPAYEPTPDEYAPVPQRDENLDVQAQPEAPPPYSWTQTPDSVTVVFPLPSKTSKVAIRVRVATKTLDLLVLGLEESSLPIPKYTARKLWDEVNSSTSYWTWDKAGEHEFGLLTLYLDKRHEGPKWMHVFEPYEGEPEVSETLDPSELHAIREAMEKFTASLLTGEDASGLGLGRGVPRMAEGELDEEVDSSFGKTAYLTWVSEDGSSPSWFDETRQPSFQLLSSPLPYSSDVSLIVKNDLDGLVYSLQSTTADDWKHSGTYSALAFVLASKQDTRFTYHIPSKAVFAFENGQKDHGGNVYIYHSTPPTQKWAKQAILKVGGGQAGSLLGVGMIHGSKILCLLERELVVIQDV